jgi:hypothetical protein
MRKIAAACADGRVAPQAETQTDRPAEVVLAVPTRVVGNAKRVGWKLPCNGLKSPRNNQSGRAYG